MFKIERDQWKRNIKTFLQDKTGILVQESSLLAALSFPDHQRKKCQNYWSRGGTRSIYERFKISRRWLYFSQKKRVRLKVILWWTDEKYEGNLWWKNQKNGGIKLKEILAKA